MRSSQSTALSASTCVVFAGVGGGGALMEGVWPEDWPGRYETPLFLLFKVV